MCEGCKSCVLDEEMRNRLKRCETCTRPDNEADGKCPGNMGLGCLGDWRCCDEIYTVCEGCTEEPNFWYCERTGCEKMKKYRMGE